MSIRHYPDFLLKLSKDERNQVNLAAQLRHMKPSVYIRAAINAQLRKEGVDAVLLKVPDEAQP